MGAAEVIGSMPMNRRDAVQLLHDRHPHVIEAPGDRDVEKTREWVTGAFDRGEDNEETE